MGDLVLLVLAGSAVCSEEDVLLFDRVLELELGLLELPIVRPVLINSLVLDGK